jgi:hypothetical protein
MNIQHTPAPWHAEAVGASGASRCMFDVVSYAPDGSVTCVASSVEGENAGMIEAAPDLLATLEQIARLAREADRSRLDVATMLGDIARAAIAKVAQP